ncbi:hypothetical protein FFLO_03337 [Filobasidium floriforme]|uniref:Uncharacterized protein n=1 Tax=Filobasidium floriforme TaxID=5210 RepID=A0A8K0JL76_9TREE|nr:hypothetical protein FFLO_03337 [Filobasidium floriforme]
MKDSKEMNEEIAEVEDHSALAEIHAAVCMARDARLAQKVSDLDALQDLHNDNEYTFTRLDFAAIKFECGKPDPLFFTPIPTTLYLYEGCLTSGLVQGNDCLKYWIHPPGQVLDLRDDQVTRVHVPGQTIHLLRTAKQRERKQSQETAGIPLGEFTTPVNQIIQRRTSVPSLLPKRHLKPETPSPPTKPSSSPPAAPQAPSSKLMPRRPGKVGSRKPRRIDA